MKIQSLNLRAKAGSVIFATLYFCCTLLTLTLFGQSGGQFSISQSVVSNGGGDASGGQFAVTTTVGQPVAGAGSTGGTFGLRSGFWQGSLAPTVALVSITGRVTTDSGEGIRGVVLTLTAPNGSRQTARTATFGYYAFDSVEVGHTYVIEIAAKKYGFTDPTRVVTVLDQVTGVDFVAVPQ